MQICFGRFRANKTLCQTKGTPTRNNLVANPTELYIDPSESTNRFTNLAFQSLITSHNLLQLFYFFVWFRYVTRFVLSPPPFVTSVVIIISLVPFSRPTLTDLSLVPSQLIMLTGHLVVKQFHCSLSQLHLYIHTPQSSSAAAPPHPSTTIFFYCSPYALVITLYSICQNFASCLDCIIIFTVLYQVRHNAQVRGA